MYLTETKLSKDINLASMTQGKHTQGRKNRNIEKGGGVMIMTNSRINIKSSILGRNKAKNTGKEREK